MPETHSRPSRQARDDFRHWRVGRVSRNESRNHPATHKKPTCSLKGILSQENKVKIISNTKGRKRNLASYMLNHLIRHTHTHSHTNRTHTQTHTHT